MLEDYREKILTTCVGKHTFIFRNIYNPAEGEKPVSSHEVAMAITPMVFDCVYGEGFDEGS